MEEMVDKFVGQEGNRNALIDERKDVEARLADAKRYTIREWRTHRADVYSRMYIRTKATLAHEAGAPAAV